MDRIEGAPLGSGRCDRRAATAVTLEELEFFARLTADAPQPSDEEIEQYYFAHQGDFKGPEMIRVEHIVKNVDEITTEDEAFAAIRAAKSEIDAERGFNEVDSDCPDRDLGFFCRGAMVPEFEDVVFSMQPGETSGIFRTPFGYHLAKVLERRSIKPLDEVRDEISEILLQETKARIIDEYLSQRESA
jgi:parvulin-like peptidyl-prolyl isomerase